MNDGPRLDRLVLAAYAVALVVFFSLPFPWTTNRFDSGITLVAADRILAGEWPYVDFQSLYTPGAYYLLAGAFGLVGRSFDVYSGLDGLLVAANGVVLVVVAKRLGGGWLRALPAAVAALVFVFPYPALSLALLGLVIVRDRAGRGSMVRTVTAGVLVGFAGFFRQDVGAVGGLALCASLFFGAPGTVRVRLHGAIVGGATALATIVVLLSPALFLNPRGLLDGLALNPAATVAYRQVENGLSGALQRHPTAIVIMSICALATAAAFAGLRWRALTHPSTDRGLLAGVAVLGLWSVRYFVLRPETHHLIPGALLLGALAAVRPGPVRARWVWPALVAAAFLLPAYRALGARANQLLGRRTVAVESAGTFVPGADTFYLPEKEAQDYERLVVRIRALTQPGEPILSACVRHDRIKDQDLVLYFVSGRPAAVFDHHFDPGVTTRADVQSGIIRDADAAGIRLVVRFKSRLAPDPPGADPGATVLDDWLAEHFELLETHGRHAIWMRRGE